MQLLGLNRDWIMPGPDYAGSVVFLEDFPYSWWEDFRRIEDLPPRCSPISRPTSRLRSSPT